MKGRRFVLISTFMIILITITLNTTAQPILDKHHIVIIQGDNPDTEQIEPESYLFAREHFYFRIPYNETSCEVAVPKAADIEGMSLDEVVYSSSAMGFIPGIYSEFWNPSNPPYKEFKDMANMDCCIANYYEWGYPENADRNLSYSALIGTSFLFNQSYNFERSDDVWNFSDSDLKLKSGEENGDFLFNSSILGISITNVEMSWDISAQRDNISFFVSVNNGTDWVNFNDQEGKEVTFLNQGNELLVKINMSQDIEYNNTPVLDSIWINVSFIPRYNDITLQLDYVVHRKDRKFVYTWDFYEDIKGGVRPHILIYTDKDHQLRSENIDIIYFGTQSQIPDKDLYIFMNGSFYPEASVIITDMGEEDTDQFPLIPLLVFFLIGLVILIIVLNLPRFRSNPPQLEDYNDSELSEDNIEEMEELKSKKEGLLKAIKKLDSDFEEGIIDEEVYLELKSSYKQKTVDVMKRMDALAAEAVVTVKEPQTSAEEESLKQEKEKLLLSIKKLDSDYEEGTIDEETYNELRNDYKNRAIEITKKLENTEEN